MAPLTRSRAPLLHCAHAYAALLAAGADDALADDDGGTPAEAADWLQG